MKELNTYLNMTPDELHLHLVTDTIYHLSEGEEITSKLEKTSRYEKDYEFRLIVDIVKGILLNLKGNFNELISVSDELLIRAKSYQMWKQLSLIYNAKGNAFFGLGMYERALEYYLLCVDNEQRHGLTDLLSTAYMNIGIIYTNVSAYDKSHTYLNLGLQVLENAGKDHPRYKNKKIQVLSYLVMQTCLNEDYDKMKDFLHQLEAMEIEKENSPIEYARMIAELYHHFSIGNLEEGKKVYQEVKNSHETMVTAFNLNLLVRYANLCKKLKIDPDFYIKDFIEKEDSEEIFSTLHAHLFFEILREYYQSIGNTEKFHKITELYIKALKKNITIEAEQAVIALGTVEDFVKRNLNTVNISKQNTELQRVAKEALLHKDALQKAYSRIELINQLGREVTSTTDLGKVVEIIYESLKENIPLDLFIIMVPDEEKQLLKPLSYYAFGELLEGENVDFNNSTSIFSECFRTSKTILSWDVLHRHRFRAQYEAEDRPSAIFLPLIVKKATIGVCSVQYAGSNAYSEYHLKFLEDLTPYLSIAINNALHSFDLKKEIKSHLFTQEKLKSLNKNLERLSTIDGLTEINRRRVFDEKVVELLKEAKEKSLSAAILMIDIDHFKNFNDTYGHLEGDEALKIVARIFRRYMDEVGGLSARFGGEEFIGAVTGLSKEQITELCEKIRAGIEAEKIPHPSSRLGILTVSVGAAIGYLADEEIKSSLMKFADYSLYQSKDNGRNQVVVNELNS